MLAIFDKLGWMTGGLNYADLVSRLVELAQERR
jgi:hypothetical protein